MLVFGTSQVPAAQNQYAASMPSCVRPLLGGRKFAKFAKVMLAGMMKGLMCTLPETNMSPKKGLFSEGAHLPTIDFQGTC